MAVSFDLRGHGGKGGVCQAALGVCGANVMLDTEGMPLKLAAEADLRKGAAMTKRLEVAVDDVAGLSEAVAGGADRIELCSALGLGGLTPSVGLMTLAADCGKPCMAMIRPRSGDFIYTVAEVQVMAADIEAVRRAGLAGIVIGAQHPDGRLHEAVLTYLLEIAQGMDVTLHRAIDLCPDPIAAVQSAKALGFRRILTSGGAKTAPEGKEILAQMMQVAGEACIIMPGSGVTVASLQSLASLSLREIHASCATALPTHPRAVELGFQSGSDKRTNRMVVAELKAALTAL